MNVVNVLTAMPPKNVVLREEAYNFLANQKRPGETFSDVVLRLRGATRPLTSFAGAWKDMPKQDLAKIRKAIREGRELDRKRVDRLLKRWEE
jgi:predicted CopG family antitoxin